MCQNPRLHPLKSKCTLLFLVGFRHFPHFSVSIIIYAQTHQKIHSRYNFGYGFSFFIVKIALFSPKIIIFDGFMGIFYFKNNNPAIPCICRAQKSLKSIDKIIHLCYNKVEFCPLLNKQLL